MKPLVGIIGSGLMGRDPFDPRSWSTSSAFFFTELRNQGVLGRAFGVEVSAARRWYYIARNFRRDREAWRMSFYNDTGYRDALTAEIDAQLAEEERDGNLLQIGAMYDVASLARPGASCFSYHDGNLAETLRSPYAPRGLPRRSLDRALAYERSVYQKMARVFSMSDYLRASFINDFDVDPENVVTVGAGINLDPLPEPPENKRYDTNEILFIGVEFARKGGWQLLEAFQTLRASFPSARLHVVGPKELNIPPTLEPGVELHGFLRKTVPTERAVLDDLFHRCSLFVMPSLYEPFGIAPLEAMVHELPCLLSDGWALREMIDGGRCGALAECGSVEDLTRRLRELLSDPNHLQRMGLAARAHVTARYTWKVVVSRMIEAMEAATQSGRGEGSA